MKKVIALVLALTLLCGLMATAHADGKIKIGVSIWSSTDTLGSEVKRLIDAAAEALDVDVQWVDQAHISEQVTASAETLAMADCDGIIICNSASAEMGSVIKTSDENEVYVAQFFRIINQEANPDEYAQACSSKYYVGAVHESEFDNGKTLVPSWATRAARRSVWKAGNPVMRRSWAAGKATRPALKSGMPDIRMPRSSCLSRSTAAPRPTPAARLPKPSSTRIPTSTL